MSGLKDWVPVALSASIEPGTSAGAIVDDAEIVVWRDDKGAPHVWEDRCPHRGMRMSFGFVRGDHIACLYHGWSYDTAGQCRHIPAHPDLEVPRTIKIPTYAVEERDGIVWTMLADVNANASAIPNFGMDLPVRSLYVDCSLEQLRAVLGKASLPSDEPTDIAAITDSCWVLQAGPLHIGIAAQGVGPNKVALHMVTDSASLPLRTSLARWAEALRRQLESADTIPVPEVA